MAGTAEAPRVKHRTLLAGVFLALTVVTGLVDAASYLGMGHVFTANMTGNLVLLGFAASGESDLSLLRAGAALMAFAAGAWAGGQMFARLSPRPGHVWIGMAFGTESALLFSSSAMAALAEGRLVHHAALLYGAIVVIAAAMGLRYTTVQRLGISEVNTSVLTGTIAALASGTHPKRLRAAASVVCMLSGAALGAFLLLHSIVIVLALAGAISAACAALAHVALGTVPVRSAGLEGRQRSKVDSRPPTPGRTGA